MENKKKKRILIILPSLRGGGAERIASYLAQGLSDNMTVDLLLRDPQNDYEIPKTSRVFVCDGKLGLLRTWLRLVLFKHKRKYDVYNSHMASSNFLNLVTGRGGGRRILTIHSVTSVQMRSIRCGEIYNCIIRWLYPEAEKIVAVTSDVSMDLQRNYGIPENKIRVIFNGNDLETIQRKLLEPLAEAERKWFENRPVISAMGRFTRAKGHISLLYAFAEVKKHFPDATLLLIGEGELREKYRCLANNLGVRDSVILTGWRENPFRLISGSDLYVMPSIYEGYGNALSEAIFCRVPCIASDFSANARIVMEYGINMEQVRTNQYLKGGILCPVPEEADREQSCLVEAMIKMLKDKDYAASCASYHLNRQNEFSLKSMLEQWEILFEGDKKD